MIDIISININLQGKNLNAPITRRAKFTAWITILLGGLFKKQGDINNNYIGGLTYSQWNTIVYNFGDRVTFGIASYEYINILPTANNLPSNPIYWYKVTNDNVGLNERLNFNCSKMQLEYILNRRFNPSNTPPPYGAAYYNIYIGNNPTSPQIAYLSRNNAVGSYKKSQAASTFYYHTQGTPFLGLTNYIIYVPTFILMNLANSQAEAKVLITTEINKYNAAGITFLITHY